MHNLITVNDLAAKIYIYFSFKFCSFYIDKDKIKWFALCRCIKFTHMYFSWKSYMKFKQHNCFKIWYSRTYWRGIDHYYSRLARVEQRQSTGLSSQSGKQPFYVCHFNFIAMLKDPRILLSFRTSHHPNAHYSLCYLNRS